MYPSLPGLTRQSIRRMMDDRIKSGHDDVMCREIMADKSGEQTIQYGVVPIDVIASMSGLDYVRAIFARRLPEPPIMQTVEPFDCTAEPGVVVIHSVPGLRHYNPIGSVHGGYAAILLDSAMGLAVQSTLPVGTGYATLEFKISFVRGMSETRAWSAPRAACSTPAAASPLLKRASPMRKVGCLCTRRRRAFCSSFRRGTRKADCSHVAIGASR